jgi:hypothetical protein
VSDIKHLPTRAEFIRDRLAEYLAPRGLRPVISNPCGLPGLTVWPCLRGATDIIVGDFKLLMDDVADPYPGFAWAPVPTDTGVMHGPLHPNVCAVCGQTRSQPNHLMPGGHHFRLAGPSFRVPGTTRTV